MKHFKYLSYIIRHKWFVLLAGIKVRASLWLLLIHDLSKFRPSEWLPYAEFFYARSKKKISISSGNGLKKKPIPKDDHLGQESSWKDGQKLRFDIAWNHHQKRNKHHWQYWLLTEDNNHWGIQQHDFANPCFIAQNNERFEFPIPIDILDQKANSELRRLVDTLNARPIALPMPEKYIREMVADWAGAGRAITGKWDVSDWYEKNKEKMTLHPDTRARVEELLSLHFDYQT